MTSNITLIHTAAFAEEVVGDVFSMASSSISLSCLLCTFERHILRGVILGVLKHKASLWSSANSILIEIEGTLFAFISEGRKLAVVNSIDLFYCS